VPVESHEISRITSPDSVVDAVLTRSGIDATTAFVYRVYLVPRGRPVNTPALASSELFRADQVEALESRWARTKLLEISYTRARIFHFSNFWNTRELDQFAYTVELRLKSVHESALRSSRQ
jgi:hypothetical protein